VNVDPAVRSIRIAAILNERFGAIIREAESVENVAEVELKIGEAQQIYPEIWRHLDEARAALDQRGVAVADFDALRATERPGQLAVANIEHTEGINVLALALGELQHFETKTASFNHEGHVKARDACDALMQAMPNVAWAELARQEAAEIAEVGSLNARKWRQLAVPVGILVLVVVVYKLLA